MLCCICMKNNLKNPLIPSQCLQKYGYSAHRICQDCWWSTFALENKNHACPGCLQKIPLNKQNNNNNNDKILAIE